MIIKILITKNYIYYTFILSYIKIYTLQGNNLKYI